MARGKVNISLHQTRKVNDFKPVLGPMLDEFPVVYLKTMLEWCDLISDDDDLHYWQVWLIRKGMKTVGVCGLYALDDNTETLWLGWFGVVPELRTQGIGKEALDLMIQKAKREKCKKIRSYIDKSMKPWPFYKRNGFNMLGTVRDFIDSNPGKGYNMEQFENEDDLIIELQIK